MDIIIACLVTFVVAMLLSAVFKLMLHRPIDSVIKNHQGQTANILVKKYAEADMEKLRPTMFRFGLIVALVLLLVSAEIYKEKPPVFKDGVIVHYDDPLPPWVEIEKELVIEPKEEQRSEPEQIIDPPVVDVKEVEKDIVPAEQPVIKPKEAAVKTDKLPNNNEAVVKVSAPKAPEKMPIIVDPKIEKSPPLIRDWVDQMPQYPGGIEALRKEVGRRYRIPTTYVSKGGRGGTITTRFVVTENGSIGEVKILKGIDDCLSCNEQAIKAIMKLKHKFEPGLQAGEAVSVWYTLPITIQVSR